MKTIKLGTLDKEVSRMGLGTWAIGGGSAWGGDKDAQESIATIRKAPELGVNLIDTAPGYNFGSSERILGQALKEMDRDKVVIITKFGVVWDREGSLFNKVNGRQLYWNLSRESILEEIDKSLERLGVDYIDVYMSHWQSVEPYFTPISETMEVLNELKAQGKIKAIGAANVTPAQVEEYLKWGSLDIVQAKYSVLDREVEKELLPICKAHGVALQAYSPLEMGLLTGALPRDYKPVGAQIPKKWFQPENLPKVFDYLDRLKPLTEKYQCSIADINMAWILAQDEKVVLLSGATTADQISQNVRSTQIDLSPEDVALIRGMAEELG
ncbi:aldo/keto reductase [Pseudoflavonifractor sp. 60]|uniref:NADH-dependent methylglyoxal reductase n=1 Tax=Pseudoflavonifractor sp. 60 TaxID=2304576 RepID=UPI001371AC08|nr:aldo/keto reductase [Pseudoflavonifractor sp. 60]NBI68178.1 aldo/keto reductase [Pseudoflavonifractor sp. 60]